MAAEEATAAEARRGQVVQAEMANKLEEAEWALDAAEQLAKEVAQAGTPTPFPPTRPPIDHPPTYPPSPFCLPTHSSTCDPALLLLFYMLAAQEHEEKLKAAVAKARAEGKGEAEAQVAARSEEALLLLPSYGATGNWVAKGTW